MLGLVLAGFFLYTWVREGQRYTVVSEQFASPAAVVETYIASMESLQASVETYETVDVNTVITRLTDVRVPYEILDTHLKAVLELERLREQNSTEEIVRSKIKEIIHRLAESGKKIPV